jgi:putative transposase
VRGSLNYVNWKERKRVAQDLKAIYRAATVEEAERQLAEFAAQLGPRDIRRSAPCGGETGRA